MCQAAKAKRKEEKKKMFGCSLFWNKKQQAILWLLGAPNCPLTMKIKLKCIANAYTQPLAIVPGKSLAAVRQVFCISVLIDNSFPYAC